MTLHAASVRRGDTWVWREVSWRLRPGALTGLDPEQRALMKRLAILRLESAATRGAGGKTAILEERKT